MKKLMLALAILVCASSSFAYYNPEQGRFINRDPIAEEGGENLYTFGLNNPVNGFDALGLDFIAIGRGTVTLTPYDHLSIIFFKDSCPPPESTKFQMSEVGIAGTKVEHSTQEDQYELVPRHFSYFLPLPKQNVISKLPSGMQSPAQRVLPQKIYIPISISFIRNTTGAQDAQIIYNGADADNQWSRIVAAAKNYRFAEHGAPGSSLTNYPLSVYGWPITIMPYELALGEVPDNNSNTFVHEMAKVIGRTADMFPNAAGNVTPKTFFNIKYLALRPIHNPTSLSQLSPLF